ncbi:MAG: helix-turn-helix domain-containing protein [Desulfuromonadales bacterium]
MSAEETPYRCTVEITLNVIGGKWKALILWHLAHRTLRFSQLRRRLPKVTQKMLTQQLRELEGDGMIHRQVYAEVPPRVEYSLTGEGQTLVPLLGQMCDWGKRHLGRRDAAGVAEKAAMACVAGRSS